MGGTAVAKCATGAADTAPGPPRPYVSIVIPCLNEERTIAACVADALAGLAAAGAEGEVVVCDNGSEDGSIDRAERAGARVVHCAAKGYGNAVRRGVELAGGDPIVIGDGDASYDFTNIAPYLAALAGGADMVVGDRFKGGIHAGAMPWLNRHVGTPALTAIVRLLFGLKLGDVNCGLRAFTRAAYDAMSLRAPGMEFASEMVAKAALAGLKVVDVPTVLRPDGRGRRPHLRPWRDGCRHLRLLIGLRLSASAARAGPIGKDGA